MTLINDVPDTAGCCAAYLAHSDYNFFSNFVSFLFYFYFQILGYLRGVRVSFFSNFCSYLFFSIIII